MDYPELKKLIGNSGRQYDLEMIDRAYRFAEEWHGRQMRESGEPFINHPVTVASLLVDLGLDTESLCAALLHDVVEDTGATLPEVRSKFGPEIALLVDGVTKLGQIPFSSVEEQQAENLRKMLLAMTRDIRVMIIKLCDRLHNMRTLDAMPEQKQRDKALETMEVFAPIAHRLGMGTIKEEFEDLSLKYLDREGYNEIIGLLRKNNKDDSFISGIVSDISERLSEQGLSGFTLESRIKSIYGIYRKYVVQLREFAEIYDVYAVRIIVSSEADCYSALGVINSMYHPIPNRYKDYIANPKSNGYQSLHTSVIGRDARVPFEIQIRTYDMHNNAEFGVAAHWKYKVGIHGKDRLEERLAWVRQLLESQKESEDSTDLLKDIKGDLLPEEIFVFTPKGDVINLPTGSSVIDFAYAIHSAVGNRMTGAKVNGRIVPISYIVKTGEIIEIMTGPKDKGPSRDWLNIVKTSEAKAKIRSWFKREKREENIVAGKQALDRELRRNLISIPPKEYDSFIEEIAKRSKFNSADELFAALGYGGLQTSRVMPKVREEYQKLIDRNTPTEVFSVPTVSRKSSEGVIVEGLDNCLVKFAKCCNPLPGDDIVGFITRGHGVSIHKRDCTNAAPAKYLADDSMRWVRVSWAVGAKEEFRSTLEIVCIDRMGLIADISSLLSNMRIPIYGWNTFVQTSSRRAIITTTIGVQGVEHLTTVMQRLRKVKDVETVERAVQ